MLGRYGLRPSEMRALEWAWIDWDAALIAVGPRLNRKNEPIGPKTRAAERKPWFTEDTLNLLRIRLDVQAADRDRAASLWNDSDRISIWAIADWAGSSERMIADVYRHNLQESSALGPAI